MGTRSLQFVLVDVLMSFVIGWSIIGSHCCALFGQFSLKKQRSAKFVL
jgi:hypothetical protein